MTANPEPLRATRAISLGLLAGSVALFLVVSREVRHPIDDAFISYRYAVNLVDGFGLVFNPGEYVEGFTNLLWTLLIAAGVALGGEAPAVASTLGRISGVLALGATWLYAATWLGGRRAWLAGVAPLILLSTYAFPRWAMSGLETPLFVALVTAALASFARERMAWTTGLLVAATCTRPDAVLSAAVVFGFHGLGRGRPWRSALGWPLAYAGALALLTGFRLFYYGAPLPNTFYAKVGGIPMSLGMLHVQAFLTEGAVWLLPPALLALGDRRTWPAAAYTLLLGLYVVWIGGDAFKHRFLLPALPCLAGLALVGAERGLARRRALGAAAAGCVAVAMLTFSLGALPASPDGLRRALDEPYYLQKLAAVRKLDRGFENRNARMARRLLARREPIRLVAAGAIGAFGYFSRLPILDIYGLVDPVVARSDPPGRFANWIPGHQRSNAEYVLSRRPDYILIQKRGAPAESRGVAPAVQALWQHPDFDQLYAWDAEVPGYRLRSR